MLSRTAVVNNLKINDAVFSSVIQIGDTQGIHGYSRALAVQRKQEIFFGKEGNFAAYPIFTEPIPFSPVTENVVMTRQNFQPFIKVNHMNILAVSSAAVVQLGNNRHVTMETRIKHIRQLLPSKNEQT